MLTRWHLGGKVRELIAVLLGSSQFARGSFTVELVEGRTFKVTVEEVV